MLIKQIVEGFDIFDVVSDFAVFSSNIPRCSGVIDTLDKQGFSNVSLWVESLDGRVEEVLMQRLTELMEAWLSTLDKVDL